jgi:hypothetical protein
MKKYIIVFCLFLANFIRVQSQTETIIHEKVDTNRTQLVVLSDSVFVNPTYNSILGKEEWDLILKSEKRRFVRSELKNIFDILSLYEFRITNVLNYEDWWILLEFEKYSKTVEIKVNNK